MSGSPKMKPRLPKSPRSLRIKAKSVHKVVEIREDEPEEAHGNNAFATSYHNIKWYPANLKFPCPLMNHKHEICTCPQFFSFSPEERWNKMKRGNCAMLV